MDTSDIPIYLAPYTLILRAEIDFLPYFLFAFQQMGRDKFGLMKVEFGGEVVYNSLENMVHNKSFWVDAEVARASTPK